MNEGDDGPQEEVSGLAWIERLDPAGRIHSA